MAPLGRSLICCLLVLGLWAPAAPAQEAEPPADKSDNVTWKGTLAEPKVISARFKDGLMYVSTLRGLVVYDIADPEAPEKVGELALPHFENEDVDLAGDILLISNDPSEGQGILYVIDISDPTSPEILSQLQTGNAADQNGLDLTVGFLQDFFPQAGGLPTGKGIGHTVSCVPPSCRYAYLAGTSLDTGIHIVDLTNPEAPKYYDDPATADPTVRDYAFTPVANGGLATHDVQYDRQGLAWFVGGGGTAGYDITNPVKPVLVYSTGENAISRASSEAANDGSTVNDFIHHNSMRIPNSSLLTPAAGADPEEDSDVVLITEEDYNRPGCVGAGSFQTWRIGAAGILTVLDKFDAEQPDPERQSLCSAHYFDEDHGLVAQGWYEQGTKFLDVSNPSDIRLVGHWLPAKNMTWGALFAPTDPTRQTVYSLDFARGIDVLHIDRDVEPDPDPLPTPTPTPTPQATPSPTPTPAPTASPAPPAKAAQRSPEKLSVRLLKAPKLRVGRASTFRVRVRNSGGTDARRVRVSVRIPRGVSYVRGGRKPRGSRVVSWRFPVLKAGASRTVKLVLRPKRGTRRVRLRPQLSKYASVSAFATAAMPTVDPARPAPSQPVERTIETYGGLCRPVLFGA